MSERKHVSDKFVLGVDIGGTKVAAGLVNAAGQVVSKTRVPMNASGSASQAMDCVHQAIAKAMAVSAPANITSIGVSSPAPLDPHSGVVLHTPNLPCWVNFPLRGEIEQRYGLPVRLDNDANAAGLSEATWGAGSGHNSVFYVTIGTGVGTAIILNGSVLYGRTGTAAEGGHMTIDFRAPVRCGCGKHGCLESMASGPAMALRAREMVAGDGASGGAQVGHLADHLVVMARRRAEHVHRRLAQVLGPVGRRHHEGAGAVGNEAAVEQVQRR